MRQLYIMLLKKGNADLIFIRIEAELIIDSKTIYVETALHLAASISHMNAVNVLYMKGASIKDTNNDGDNVLHLVVYNGHVNVVQI